MVDFDLTPFDREMLRLTHEQALIARTHARSYDGLDELYVPDELPEAKDHPNVRQVIKERVGEASGAAILDIMIYLEEMWGTIPFRKGSNEATFLGSKLVEVLGSPEQYERWKSMGMAIALTEPGAGSDPSRIRTMACQDEETGEWVVNGEKIFISLAHSCQAIVLFGLARTAEGIVPGIFVVEKGTRGLSISPQLKKLGQRGWDTANLHFSECRIPAGNRLMGNMKNMLPPFNVSRPWVAAIGLAFARASLDLTRDWFEKKGMMPDYRFDAAPADWRTHRFLELEAEYEACWLTLLHTKWIEDMRGADKLEAAMTKAQSGGATRRIINGCMELLGPESASEAHLMEMWLRDSRVCDIYEGAGEVNRLIIARDLLGYSPKELA